MLHEEHESLLAWFISTTSDLRVRSNQLKPILPGVQLLQFFISRRLYKPEAGDDAPRQGAGNENTCPGPEALNEDHDHCGDPDNGQCDVQSYVVYTNYELFHVYSLLSDCPLAPYARASGRHDREIAGCSPVMSGSHASKKSLSACGCLEGRFPDFGLLLTSSFS